MKKTLTVTLIAQLFILLIGWGTDAKAQDVYNFETGDLSEFSLYTNTVAYPWTVVSGGKAYEGSYCMKSCSGINSLTSDFTTTYTFPAGTYHIEFWAKISSESGKDKGYFYIGSTAKINGISGDGSWTHYDYEFTVSSGSTTFKWSYKKNASGNSYDDCLYVDDIRIYNTYQRPTSLTFSNVQNTAVDVSWVDASSPAPDSWQVSYYTTAGTPSTSTVVTATATSTTITELTYGKRYYLAVRSKYGSNYSQWSNVAVFTAGDNRETTLLLHDGNVTNATVPMWGAYCDNYQKSEFIIPAEELYSVAGGSIKKLKFYLNSTPSWTQNHEFKVYLKEVTNATYSGTSFTSSATLVYDGDVTFANNELVIDFAATNFSYTETDKNLVVQIYHAQKNRTAAATTFYGVTSTGSSLSGYSTTTTSFSGTPQNFLPKVQISYIPPQTPKPRNLTLVSSTTSNTTLSWTDTGSPESWQVSWATSSGAHTNTVTTTTNSNFELTGLTYNTKYYISVRGFYGGSTYSAWSSEICITAGESLMGTLLLHNGSVTNEKIPIYGNYCDEFTKSEFIIPADELEDVVDGCFIKKMRFYLNSTPDWTSGHTFKVYLKEIDNATFADANFIGTSGTTTVYSGDFTFANNEMEITFTTDFSYTTGRNLLVCVYNTAKKSYASTIFYGVSAPGASLCGNSSTSLAAVEGTQQNFLPKVQITYLPTLTPTPRNFTLISSYSNATTLSWTDSGSPESWQVSWGTTSGAHTNSVTTTTNTNYQLTGLTYGTKYYLSVRGYYGGSTYSAWSSEICMVAGESMTSTLMLHEGSATNETIPMYGNYCDEYTKSQFIIPASELSDIAGGYIEKMRFYLTNTPAWESGHTLKVYLKEVTNSTYTNTSFISPGSTVYYSGDFTFEDNELEIALTTFFPYTSGNNLLVSIYNTVPATYAQTVFYGEEVSNSSLSGSNSEALNSVTGTQQNFLPQVQFTYLPSLRPKPRNVAISSSYSNTATVQWTELGAPDSWQISCKTTSGSPSSNYTATTNPYEITGLTYGTKYYLSIRGAYAGSQYSPWSDEISFRAGESSALTLHIHEGSDTGTAPFDPYNCEQYQKTEFIIPKEDLVNMADGVITQMSFQLVSPGELDTNPTISVYMQEVSATEVTGYTFSGSTNLVYSGTVDVSSNPVVVTLTTPKTYTGNNLRIGFYETTPASAYINSVFYGESVEGNTCISGCDKDAMSNVTVENSTITGFLPETTFSYLPSPTPRPSGLTVSDINEASVTLNWTEVGSPTNWQVSYSTTSGSHTSTVTATTNNNYVLTGLTRGTKYYVSVRGYYGGSTYSSWSSETSFTCGSASMTLFEDETDYNDMVPVYGYYADVQSKSEFIIPATELSQMSEGIIKSMTFYIKTPAEVLWVAPYQIYMKEVPNSEFKTNALLGSGGATKVYQGTLDGTGSTMTINFSTSYTYNGGNLWIGAYCQATDPEPEVPYNYSPCIFYGKEVAHASVCDVPEVDFYECNFIPKTTFSYIKVDRPKPGNLSLVQEGAGAATLSWSEGGTATAWQVRYSTSSTYASGVTYQSSNMMSRSVFGLTGGSTYYMSVRSDYGGGIYSNWSNSVSFVCNADGYTIYDPPTTTNKYFPIYGYYADTQDDKSEFVIPASDLKPMKGSNITKMTFYLETLASGPWTGAKFTIYMKEVSDTIMTGFVGDEDATLVWNNKALSGSAATMAITLDSPYYYTGGNLLVGIYVSTAGTAYSDDNTPMYYGTLKSYNASYNTRGFASTFLPKTTFNYELLTSIKVFTTSGNWNVAGNWVGGIPTADDVAWITANATIPNGYTAYADEVELKNGTGTLTINEGGQLIHNNAGLEATVKKNITAATKDAADHWYSVASPVGNIVVSNITNLQSDPYDLYRFNETEMMWENFKAGHEGFTGFEMGRGYLYRNGNAVTLEYNGALNVASATYALTVSDNILSGFQLIGNPFAHNIYKGAGTAIDDAKLNTGFYILSDDGSWQVCTDNSTAITPCTGVLVQANTEGELTITNTTAQASAKANQEFIRFVVANSRYEDVAYAWFDNAGGLTKIEHRNAEIPMIYIPQDGEEYAIATMSDDTKTFNLNFKTSSLGQYTLKTKTKGVFEYLHVIDKFTGEDVDMLVNGEYKFVGSPADAEDRFIVRLEYRPNYDTDSKIFAYQSGNDIVVRGDGELQVFDVMGRLVAKQQINGVGKWRAASAYGTTGVYILRLVGTEMKTQKIVIR